MELCRTNNVNAASRSECLAFIARRWQTPSVCCLNFTFNARSTVVGCVALVMPMGRRGLNAQRSLHADGGFGRRALGVGCLLSEFYMFHSFASS